MFIFKQQKIDGIAKHYSKALLTDVTHMLEKYMGLVKNFPAVFNGTKLRVTLENIMHQINKVASKLTQNKATIIKKTPTIVHHMFV